MSNRPHQNAVAILTAAAGKDAQAMADMINQIALKDTQATIASLAGMTVACLDTLAANMGVSVEQFLAQMGAVASLE